MTKITQSIKIKGNAGDIYQAIATEQGVKNWWTNFASVDEFVGGKAEFHFPAYDVSKFAEIKTLEPGKQVTWYVTEQKAAATDWVDTTIDFQLSEADGETLVEFNHTGWPENASTFEQCVNGWDYFLKSLKLLVETGTGTPETKATVAAQ